MKNYTLLLINLFLCLSSYSDSITEVYQNNIVQNSTDQNLYFRENKGQVKDQDGKQRSDILYSGQAQGLIYHLKSSGLQYQLNQIKEVENLPTKNKELKGLNKSINNTYYAETYRVDVYWLGANPNTKIIAGQPLPDFDNFYNVPDGSQPALKVRSYEEVKYENIYPGISLKYYEGIDHNLEYDFELQPGADYKNIKLKISGAEIHINKKNELVFETPYGSIIEGNLKIKQNNRLVEGSWELIDRKNGIVGLKIEQYDKKLSLIIDPLVRVWGTYYGGSENDQGYCCTTDVNGNAYLGGKTISLNNIATTGAFQQSFIGNEDAFLVKFNSNGSRLWGTYYGGSSNDEIISVAAGGSGNIYIFGNTTSSSGIATAGAYQTTQKSYDTFLAQFTADGSRVWGTYFGGPGSEDAFFCILDSNESIYITGESSSTTGMATPGAHQETNSGYDDVFLAKMSSSGFPEWCTYYGGYYYDWAGSCAVDENNFVYLCGSTVSSVNISTPGSYQSEISGNNDAFLVKFSTSGTRHWGTYFGGIKLDEGIFCTSDKQGSIYLIGNTNSDANIATPGTYMTNHQMGTDIYVAKFSSEGSRVWGTYYGGNNDDYADQVVSDVNGYPYVYGETLSADGISTPDGFQNALGGLSDACLAKFSQDGLLIWGTYYGGYEFNRPSGCAIGLDGSVFISGETYPSYVVATSGSYQEEYGGGTYDAFLAKFSECNFSVSLGPDISKCGGTVALDAGIGASYLWSNGSTNRTLQVYSSGSYFVKVTDINGCSASDTVNVTIFPIPDLTIQIKEACCSTCPDGSLIAAVNGGTNPINYSWSPGGCNTVDCQNLLPNTYTLNIVDANGCSNSQSATVQISPTIELNIFSEPATCSDCPNGKMGAIVTGGIYPYTYLWNPGGFTTPICEGVLPGDYTLIVTDANGCNISKISTIQYSTGISESFDAGYVLLYPNPAMDEIVLRFDPDNCKNNELFIENINGQILSYVKLEDQKNILKVDISTFKQGIYLLKIKNTCGQTIRKLLKI